MRISELISELKELKKEYGDIQCAIFDETNRIGGDFGSYFKNYVGYIDVVEFNGEFLVRF